jgi:energy-coupling factor transporter ATP-binding protein EcfA2
VIRVPHRLVQLELKSLSQSLPLLAKANGPWRQVRPDGSTIDLEKNAFEQAKQATYSLSDRMRRLALAGSVRNASPFYKHIDTVVCVQPAIPPDSEIEVYPFVSLIGSDGLLSRLTSPGHSVPLSDEEWAIFLRDLGVYPEADDSTEGLVRRDRLNLIGDYQHRLVTALDFDSSVDLPGIVDGTTAHAVDLASLVRDGRVVLVLGPSGAGKTTLAKHAAVQLCGADAVPVLVPCADFETGRFLPLISRAIAPYASVVGSELLSAADRLGKSTVLIFDQLDRCAPELIEEFLGHAEGLRRRHSCGVLLTSTQAVRWQGAVEHMTVMIEPPDQKGRRAILRVHGCPDDLELGSGVKLPLHLSIAAKCGAELAPNATRLDLMSAYVRAQSGSEQARAGLRRLAALMDEQVRASLPFEETVLGLERDPAGVIEPKVIDEILRSALLVTEQGRVRFVHESFERFLYAESLVRSARTGAVLGTFLTRTTGAEARGDTLRLEPDPERRREALVELGDSKLLLDAAAGAFGDAVASALIGQVREVLAEGTLAVEAAEFSLTGETGIAALDVKWRHGRDWSRGEASLFALAGHLALRGQLRSEVVSLFDHTDEAIRRNLARLRAEGAPVGITGAVAATYVFGHEGRSNHPAAYFVLQAIEFGRVFELRDSVESSALGFAGDLLRGSERPPSWGRLLVAANVLKETLGHEADLVAEVVRAAERVRGYHVRFEALQLAFMAARSMTPENRAALVEALQEVDPGNDIGLSSMLVEALAACGEIEPLASNDEIAEMISVILANEDDPDAQKAAQRIYGNQFENEEVIGPYSEVIGSLDEKERLRLLSMAARSGERGFAYTWLIAELSEHALELDDSARGVLAAEARNIEVDSTFPQDAVLTHVHGIAGWASLSDQLPPDVPSDDPLVTAWQTLDSVLFSLARPGTTAEEESVEAAWCQLIAAAPHAAAALDQLSLAVRLIGNGRNLYAELVETHPEHLADLACKALQQRSALPVIAYHSGSLAAFLVGLLGVVGTKQSANYLRTLLADPELADAVPAAIRAIEERTEAR